MATVDLYFDFISPYAYLALEALPDLQTRHGLTVRYHPIVFGAMLTARGLVGPVECDAKRRYTFVDVLRRAKIQGVPMAGVPAHPFRSLEALRTVCLFDGAANLGDLVQGLARAGWGEGRDLASLDVLQDVVIAAGLDGADLAARIGAADTKQSLLDSTHRALDAGVFGVPTFALGDELFWGHDRMEDLERRLAGEQAVDPDLLEEWVNRPRAVDRRR